MPSSRPTTIPSGPPLAVTPRGHAVLRRQIIVGRVLCEWSQNQLAAAGQAQGEGNADGDVALVIDRDGRLFLFNSPGRVVRLSPTPDSTEPFKHDATFSHKIPSTDAISRIWLDPANRIIIAHDTKQLAICFPSGVIPQSIAELMPAGEQDDDFESLNEDP